MDDTLLINKIKQGDRSAFNELYGNYWALLVNYAGLFVDDSATEDIVQELFVKIWMGRDNLRESGSLRSYLLRSVYNASMNRLRHEKHRLDFRTWASQQVEEGCYAYYDPDKSDVITRLYATEVRQQIEEAINSLPPKCREVFRMSHIDGMSNREIGENLGLSLSTVENHINHALKCLRAILGPRKMLILLTFYMMSR